MNNDREVTELLEQLRDLHIQQSVLVGRIINIANREQVHEATATTPTATAVPTTYTATGDRPYQIGDQVKINNPRPLQFKYGTVKRIGATQITVESSTGKTLSRLPKNLTLLHPATPTFHF